MEKESKRKILGSFIVGFALVAGAYTIAGFGTPRLTQPAALSQPEVPARMAIAVSDNDSNGIEDWRDSFVTTEPIIIKNNDVDYEVPSTLTGKLGINFLESIITNRATVGRNDSEVIDDMARQLEAETLVQGYDVPDIIILDTYSDTDVKNYFNTLAGIIERNSPANSDYELNILYEITNRGKSERLPELKLIANSYQLIIDDTLTVPVPALFVKEHLDLLNTYTAVQADIAAMTKVLDDPVVSLLRMKRYEDDALGLNYALQNIYLAMRRYPNLFEQTDSAMLFINFIPPRQI